MLKHVKFSHVYKLFMILIVHYLSISEYIEFWLDNIHCYCTDFHTASSQCKENMELNPPVIIVGTGIDKIPPV